MKQSWTHNQKQCSYLKDINRRALVSALLHPRDLQVIKDLISSFCAAVCVEMSSGTDVMLALNQRVPTQEIHSETHSSTKHTQRLPKQHDSLTPDLPEPRLNNYSKHTQRSSRIPVPTREDKTTNKNTQTKSALIQYFYVNSSQQQSRVFALSSGQKRLFHLHRTLFKHHSQSL